ncbi:MAG: hypothetical protein R3E99_19100 [Burkholderiaceae bacterium]
MGATIDRPLSAAELARMPEARQEMATAGAQGGATRFTFFAAFDGTFNDEGNLKLSGTALPTNVSQLRKQAHGADTPYLESRYYPGVGTGGDQGGVIHAGIWPTQAIEAAANKAYVDLRRAALDYLERPDATPADLGVAVTGFSRGAASAIRFAQLVNERGLVGPAGEVVAPPGSIPVTAMALIDPVARHVRMPMDIPPNVQGTVLSVIAQHETRTDFRPLYYITDPRVAHVDHPGNHVGTGGGYDPHGTAASVLEGVTGYFQRRGVAMADVAPERRHDPQSPQILYTEVWKTPRSGDLSEDDLGQRPMSWAHDPPGQGRVMVRPRMSPRHADWLRLALAELSPELKARGLDAEGCLRVAVACVRSTAQREAMLGPPRRFMLSADGQRVGVVHEVGVLHEVSVSQAMQTPTLEHLRLLEHEQQPAQAAEAGRAWTRRDEQEHTASALAR